MKTILMENYKKKDARRLVEYVLREAKNNEITITHMNKRTKETAKITIVEKRSNFIIDIKRGEVFDFEYLVHMFNRDWSGMEKIEIIEDKDHHYKLIELNFGGDI